MSGLYDYQSAFRLDGKTALITGGAQGLGKEFAYALGSSGARVAIMDIKEEPLRKTQDELVQQGIDCDIIVGDITSESDAERSVSRVLDNWNSLDIVVNNAGIVDRISIEQMSLAAWNRTMSINVTGVFLMSKYASQAMIRKGHGGSIINMASMSGIIVNTPMEQAAYNTSKAAVAMFTKSCATEWAEYDIRVNAIAPGYMQTEMTGPDFEQGGQFHHLLDAIPMKRLGLPRELGGLAIWLASNASSYVTGSVVSVDGGYTLW